MEISGLSENLFMYVAMYWVIITSDTPQKIAIDPSMRQNRPLTVTPSGRLEGTVVDKTPFAN